MAASTYLGTFSFLLSSADNERVDDFWEYSASWIFSYICTSFEISMIEKLSQINFKEYPGIMSLYHYLNGESLKNENDPELINEGGDDICWLWLSIIHDDAFRNDKNLCGRVINFV